MDLRQLRYFLQIVESGSMSGAADILRVAQPSLSQHVHGLEEELGVNLLTRHARGVVPTELGVLLCHHARRVLAEVERTREALRLAADSPGGEVMVGLPTSACWGLSVPLITAAEKRYPRIAIHIVEAMTGSLDEWVQSGRLDVALLYDHKAADDTVASEVMIEDLRLIVGRDHALAGVSEVQFGGLTSLRLVLPSRPHVIRTVVESAAARAGQPCAITMNCDSLAAIKQLVRVGYATLFPSFSMADEIGRGDLVAVRVVNPTPSWRLSVALSTRSANPESSEAIAGLMTDVVRDLVSRGAWDAAVKQVR